MKAVLKKVTPTTESSFNIHTDVGKNMLSAWHFHSECELLLIQKSSGTCLIGDYIGPFESDEVFLFGSNLPHTFIHDNEFMQEGREGHSIVILFQKEFLGADFFNLPEIKEIGKLLILAKQGLRLFGDTRKKVTKLMKKTLDATPGKKLITLLTSLQLISETKEYEIISSYGFTCPDSLADNKRINIVFEFTFKNYNNKITLEEVAALLKMPKHSFCRYFKSKTNKTYIQFLMEVRIGQACKLLVEEDLNVKEVGYSCGYNNTSNFYHQFKTIMKKNPFEYKRNYLVSNAS